MNVIASNIINAYRNCADYNPIKALKLMDLLFRDRVEEAHMATQQRRALIHRVKAYAENGKVAIVNSGMDCDCSRWENHYSIVDATIEAVDEWIEDFYANAEGPQGCYIELPSVARTLRASSRDLVLEAFENGNQYAVSTAGE